MNVPRGIRNNNPGNIDRNKTKWQGMADDQSSDPRFVVYKTPQFGIRAMAVTLLTYEHKYGINTIRKAVNRWAPPVENDTGAYVDAVCKDAGLDADAPEDFDDCAVMTAIVKAIIHHENGQQPYSDTVIEEGLHMAGVMGAKPKPLHKDTAFVTKVGGAAVTAVATAVQYAPQAVPVVHGWRDQLQDYVSIPVFAHAVTALTFIGGGLVVVSIVATMIKQRKLV
jgi:hypothetical protein